MAGRGLVAPNGVPPLGLAAAAAEPAGREDHIAILNEAAAKPAQAKRDALVSVAHTIVVNGDPANLVEKAQELENKYRDDEFDEGQLENDYSDFQDRLEQQGDAMEVEDGGRRRRRGKKSRKPRKGRASRRMTRRRRGGVSVMANLRERQQKEMEEDMRKKSAAMDAVMDKMHQEFLATKEGSVVNAAKDALDAWSKENRGAGAVLQITFPEGVTPEDFDTIFKKQIEKYNIDGHNGTELDFFFDGFSRDGQKDKQGRWNGKVFVNNTAKYRNPKEYLEKLLYAMEHEKRGSGKKSTRHRSKRHTQRR
jgi:hypothetical protein